MVIDEYNRQLAVKGAMLNGPQTLWVIIDSFEYDDNLAGARFAKDLYGIETGRLSNFTMSRLCSIRPSTAPPHWVTFK